MCGFSNKWTYTGGSQNSWSSSHYFFFRWVRSRIIRLISSERLKACLLKGYRCSSSEDRSFASLRVKKKIKTTKKRKEEEEADNGSSMSHNWHQKNGEYLWLTNIHCESCRQGLSKLTAPKGYLWQPYWLGNTVSNENFMLNKQQFASLSRVKKLQHLSVLADEISIQLKKLRLDGCQF